ncbi:MAG: hypothetical protein ORN58_08255 [Sediminibacterium sp.]|nr:hypothetical protein [Sediminibacterium sp.]
MKKQSVREYLEKTKDIVNRFEAILKIDIIKIYPPFNEKQVLKLTDELKKYKDYCKIFINQIKRRLLLGEEIPASEKIYSIFEEHTEWVNKGKYNKRVELGRNKHNANESNINQLERHGLNGCYDKRI